MLIIYCLQDYIKLMEEEQQKIEKQKDFNMISLIKSPQQFRKMFQQIKKMSSQRLQMHQFETAIQYYLKCIDMLDLGKNILLDINPLTKASLYISLAASYQGAWKIQKCNKFCEKAEEELGKIINEQDTQQYLKIGKYLVTLKFQHCAILSQLNQHQQALKTCKSTLVILNKTIQIIYNFSKKQEESINMKNPDQGVIFSRKVYGLADQILSNLIQQISDIVDYKHLKSSNFYFWQRNPQKNEEQLKKIFLPQNNNNSKRSILGVNKQNHWIDQFNIGSIMRMSQLKTQKQFKNIPMEEYLFKDKLYQIVINCSLAFFTIATEMRFLDAEKGGSNNEIKNEKDLNRLQTIKKKYGYEQKSQSFKLSQAYHLRAIQIISSNIQASIPYLTHMIKSYDKHYVFKKKLQQIAAYGDESALEMSSVADPSKIQSKINITTDKNKYQVKKAYEIDIKTPENHDEERIIQFKTHEDYQTENNQNLLKVFKQRDAIDKRKSKQCRNTLKFYKSQDHFDEKGRAKSTGKLRKPKLTQRQQKTEKLLTSGDEKITNFLNKGKKKTLKDKDKDKQKEKSDKFKKTRIKLTQFDAAGQGQLHVRTKSSTHIKFVFKKKK